jgi:transposase
MRKVNKLCFQGETIFCGLDVHKKNWRVNVRDMEFELEDFSQDPCAELLAKHLWLRYPKAKIKVAYEAGFCGFGIQRSLKQLGIDCMVVNAADVPTTDKEKKRKQDKVDARKLCYNLSKRQLTAIYVPEPVMEQARALVRQRARLVWDQTRCKNRIWQLLMCHGLPVEANRDKQYWSKRFITLLKQLDCRSEFLRQALDLALDEFISIRKLVNDATRALRKLAGNKLFADMQTLIRSIPGIGLINGMIIIVEIQDMQRFETLDSLCAYVGIVPDTESSGDIERVKGITKRCNWYLRTAIVESSWTIIRHDPALLMKYKRYCKRMEKNKAIIKIAKHLLARIRYVWTRQTPYQIAIVN